MRFSLEDSHLQYLNTAQFSESGLTIHSSDISTAVFQSDELRYFLCMGIFLLLGMELIIMALAGNNSIFDRLCKINLFPEFSSSNS